LSPQILKNLGRLEQSVGGQDLIGIEEILKPPAIFAIPGRKSMCSQLLWGLGGMFL